jgi:hypothetical protein
MKKKLEAELISIAHRVLQIKNKEDIRELKQEAGKLYEKLSVLLFVEENFSDVKPTIGTYDVESKLETIFYPTEKNTISEENDKNQADGESIIDNKVEPIAIINNIMGALDYESENVTVEKTNDKEPIIKFEDIPVKEVKPTGKNELLFDDLMAGIKGDIIFERVDSGTQPAPVKPAMDTPREIKTETKHEETVIIEKPIATNLNDKLKKSINIALNDRLAFEKNLFGGSSEDFNRVLSQLSTFDNLTDAKKFLNEIVKPDYDNWKGKEEFTERLMEIIENKFI